MMHTFMDNFSQGGKYSAQIASHQVELRREENITDQTLLKISSLQTGYLNLDRSSGLVEMVIEKTLFRQSAHFVEVLINLQKNVSNRSDRKRKKIVRLVLWTIDERNGTL